MSRGNALDTNAAAYHDNTLGTYLRYKVKGSLMLYTVRVHLHQECILLASANDLANNLMMFLNVSVSDLAGLR